MLFELLHASLRCGMLYAVPSCPVVSCFLICCAVTYGSHLFVHVTARLTVLLRHGFVCVTFCVCVLSEVIKCHPMLLQE